MIITFRKPKNIKMKLSILEISALLYNVDDFSIMDCYEYYIKVLCNDCQKESSGFKHFNYGINIPRTSADGLKTATYNATYECEFCSHIHKINILQDFELPYKAKVAPNYQPFLVLECRGCKPTQYYPSGFFQCFGRQSGELFDKIELDDRGSWLDFDGASGRVVGVYGFKYRFSHFAMKKRPKPKMEVYNEKENEIENGNPECDSCHWPRPNFIL